MAENVFRRGVCRHAHARTHTRAPLMHALPLSEIEAREETGEERRLREGRGAKVEEEGRGRPGRGGGGEGRVERGWATIDVWSQDTDAGVDKHHIEDPPLMVHKHTIFVHFFFLYLPAPPLHLPLLL